LKGRELGVEWTKSPGKGMGKLDVSRIEGSKPSDEEENVAGNALSEEGQSGTRNHYLYSHPYDSQDLNLYHLSYANLFLRSSRIHQESIIAD